MMNDLPRIFGISFVKMSIKLLGLIFILVRSATVNATILFDQYERNGKTYIQDPFIFKPDILTKSDKVEFTAQSRSQILSHGLKNLGNTCYLNAAINLIALSNLKDLAFKKYKKHSSLPSAQSHHEAITLKKKLRALILCMSGKTSDIHCDKPLKNIVKFLKKTIGGRYNFDLYSQQDPAEFLNLLFDHIDIYQSPFRLEIREYIEKQNEVISFDLPNKFLILQPHLGDSIQELIHKFFEPEVLSETSIKRMGVIRAPQTLLLQLARIESHLDLFKDRKKIKANYTINIPYYQKSSSGLVHGEAKLIPYRLKAIIVREGSFVGFGHYFTYGLSKNLNAIDLFKLNDQFIESLPIRKFNKLVSRDAYILAYDRMTTDDIQIGENNV